MEAAGSAFPADVVQIVEEVARQGSTPLVVADAGRVLEVVELKDIVKGGIKERFGELRRMGIRTVMITGDNRLTAAAIAAEAGVDDYLCKPFGVGELLARVRAASRRLLAAGAPQGAIFNFGDVAVDFGLRTVCKADKTVHLTPIEYRLLGLLVANAGKVLTHRQILREVWGPSHADDGHYVRVYMGHLRHKLEDDPTQPKHILTETAVGYRLVQHARHAG